MSLRWSVAQSSLVPGRCAKLQFWNKGVNTNSLNHRVERLAETQLQIQQSSLISNELNWQTPTLAAFDPNDLQAVSQVPVKEVGGLTKEPLVVQFNTINIVSDSDEIRYLLSPAWLVSLIVIFIVLLTSLVYILMRLSRKKLRSGVQVKLKAKIEIPHLNGADTLKSKEAKETGINSSDKATPIKPQIGKVTKAFKSDEFIPKQLRDDYTPLSCKKPSKISVSSRLNKIDCSAICIKDTSPFNQIHYRCDIVRKLSDRFIEKLTKNSDHLSTHSTDLSSTMAFAYENNKFENSFTDIVEIGTHPSGKIYKALHKLEGVYYTIKRIDFNLREGDDLRSNHMFREVSAMVNLHHKNVMRLITSWVEKHNDDDCDLLALTKVRAQSEFKPADITSSDTDNSDFEIIFEESPNDKSKSVKSQDVFNLLTWDKVSLYIQMEFCSGTAISKYIVGNECELTDSDIFLVFNEIVDGLAYIHAKGLIHRNLNPDNIFINSKGEIKIGEFGVATVMIDQNKTDSIKGTLRSESSSNLLRQLERFSKNFEGINNKNINTLYKAPETNKNAKYDNKADVYSVGVILYELLNRYRTSHEKIKQIELLKSTNKVTEMFAAKYPLQSAMIEALISPDPAKRPAAREIFGLKCFYSWEAVLK